MKRWDKNIGLIGENKCLLQSEPPEVSRGGDLPFRLDVFTNVRVVTRYFPVGTTEPLTSPLLSPIDQILSVLRRDASTILLNRPEKVLTGSPHKEFLGLVPLTLSLKSLSTTPSVSSLSREGSQGVSQTLMVRSEVGECTRWNRPTRRHLNKEETLVGLKLN